MSSIGSRFSDWALAVACFLLATTLASEERAPRTALETAKKLHAAFNQHDAAAMALLVANDFELYYVDNAGAAALAVRGPEQLRKEMSGYFTHNPDVKSEMVDVVDGPAFVAFREQVVGGSSSLAVYEVRDGLVKRVWYYPAEESGQ